MMSCTKYTLKHSSLPSMYHQTCCWALALATSSQRPQEHKSTFCAQEVCATIFSAKNIKISNDRLGLTRSAILLVLFIVIHAVGNLHVFKGGVLSFPIC